MSGEVTTRSRAEHLECSRSHRRTEWVGIVVTALVMLLLAIAVLAMKPWTDGLLVLGIGLVVGILVADLGSGALHWAFDTYFDVDQRAFSRAVRIAREHHERPAAILQYSFRDYVSFSAWPTLVLFGPVAATSIGLTGGSARSAAVTAVLIVFTAMFFGSHTHALGHHWSNVAVLRWMQRAGLIMSPRHHRLHHNGIHLTHYCTFVGVMNLVCDRWLFWRFLEGMIEKAIGHAPRTHENGPSLVEAAR
ncbi:MAG: fatty acid desaturase CarF family protein [Acidimicrobiales bacterium]